MVQAEAPAGTNLRMVPDRRASHHRPERTGRGTNSPNANDTSSGGSQSPLATRPLSEQRSGPHLHPLALVSAWNPLLQPRPWSQDCPAEGGECPAGWGLCPVTSSVTPSIFTSSCLCSERRGPQHSVKDSGLRHVHRPGSHAAGCALAALCVSGLHSMLPWGVRPRLV